MRRMRAIVLGAAIIHGQFATEVAAVDLPPQHARRQQSENLNVSSYLHEALEDLVQRVPELRELKPPADQEELPMILESTGERVDEFFRHVVDLSAHEEVTEEKLNEQGSVTERLQVQDDYLILRRGTEMFGKVREYRMDNKGNLVDEVGANRGFFDTANFALEQVYFANAFQPESDFRLMGEQKIDSRDTYVVAFAQDPGRVTVTVSMERRKPTPLTVSMLVQGIAWIDKGNFQIVRLRTDLLKPYPQIDLHQLTTTVAFQEVQLAAVQGPLWLPSRLEIRARFAVPAAGNHGLMFHNEHRYSDYRYYRVSVRMVQDQAKPATPPNYIQPAGIGDETYYANAHPYLELPASEIHKRIPELRKLRPASDQQILPGILQRTAVNTDEFFGHIVDLIANEKITQKRLNGAGVVAASEQVRDNYLVLRRGTNFGADIIEYRMDAHGNRMDQIGLAKGYLVTFGFALICNYFSSAFQPESQFRYLGEQKVGSHETYVVAFAQQPGKATLYVTMSGRQGTLAHMLMQGIAWIDQSNFQVLQMRTDLLAPHPEIGLDLQSTVETLSKVELADVTGALWLPKEVQVRLKFRAFDSDSGSGSYEVSYHNEHHYSEYRRYRVSTKMLVPK